VSEPSPRQVLYALVAAGFQVVVAVLIAGAAVARLVPGWWTATTTVGWLVVAATGASGWRRTGRVLGSTVGLFLGWTVGTLVVS
jgi:hypothetical protein